MSSLESASPPVFPRAMRALLGAGFLARLDPAALVIAVAVATLFFLVLYYLAVAWKYYRADIKKITTGKK